MVNVGETRRAFVLAIRRTLRALPKRERCDPDCPGWIVSDSDEYGTQIEACDECASARQKLRLPKLDDRDLALLPEACKALVRELSSVECMTCDARAYQCETGDPGCYHCVNGHTHRETGGK